MEETEMELTGASEKGFIGKMKNRIFENWQTILVILIVLVVGASAYNYNQQNTGKDQSSPAAVENDSSKENQTNAAEDANTEQETEKADQEKAAQEDKAASLNSETGGAKEENKNKNNNEEENKEAVTASSTDSGKEYKVKAARGEGITHLARKALEEYLKGTSENANLTPEHKIYIEDYIQNRIGSYAISVGHEETFKENIIKDAVSNAQNLSPSMLKNLEKYTTNP